MSTICLKTNQNRLIANLRYAFTPYSMLGELLQNARRAGASQIHITARDNTLIIRDDGSGIADLQTLIFIAESGWDHELQNRENSFGMGVLSTLYFAETLAVHSGDKAFCAPTASIIRGDDIEVYTKSYFSGTEIQLDGVQSPQAELNLAQWLEQQLKPLCEAFPVEVIFNGTEIDRPLAETSLPWKETPMGRVLINLSGRSWERRYFLQGLPIEQKHVASCHQVILLRDDILARLPDRQSLLNGANEHHRIQAAIDAAYRQALIEAKEKWAGAEFVLLYAESCLLSKNADLLNDIPFVLLDWFRNWDENPAGYCRDWERYMRDGVETREAIEEVGVWHIDDDDNCLAAETYLEARKAFLLEEGRLDTHHWLRNMIKTITPEQIQVRHGAILHENKVPPITEDIELVLVDTLSVSFEGVAAEYQVKALIKNDVLFLTAAADSVTRLISSYVYDDIYREDLEDEDAEAIRTFIAIGYSHDPCGVINALLPDSLRYTPQPKLAGAKVQLMFDSSGKLQTVCP